MKTVLVAGDFAQSEVMRMLGEVLQERGVEVVSFLRGGRAEALPTEAIKHEIASANNLVVTMSNLSDDEVMAVTEAHRIGVRCSLYADTFGNHRLPAFEPVRDFVETLFVINADEGRDAATYFPKANIVATGNPRWEEFAFPVQTRVQARERLSVFDDRKLILCPGDKYLALNMLLFGAAGEAVGSLNRRFGSQIELLIGFHPGDLNSPSLYEDVWRYAGCPVKVVGKHVGIPTSEIVIGCDMVVEFNSTIGIQAACLRKPVIDFCTTVALKGRPATIGKDPWKLVELGASEGVYFGSVDKLACTIKRLLHPGGFESMRAHQESAFPVPKLEERGQAIRRMVATLI